MFGMVGAVSLSGALVELTVAMGAGNIEAGVYGVATTLDDLPEHPASQKARILIPNRPTMINRKFGRQGNALPKPSLLGFSATFGPRQLRPISEATAPCYRLRLRVDMEDTQVINVCLARQAL